MLFGSFLVPSHEALAKGVLYLSPRSFFRRFLSRFCCVLEGGLGAVSRKPPEFVREHLVEKPDVCPCESLFSPRRQLRTIAGGAALTSGWPLGPQNLLLAQRPLGYPVLEYWGRGLNIHGQRRLSRAHISLDLDLARALERCPHFRFVLFGHLRISMLELDQAKIREDSRGEDADGEKRDCAYGAILALDEPVPMPPIDESLHRGFNARRSCDRGLECSPLVS